MALPLRRLRRSDRDQRLELEERRLTDALHVHQLLDLISNHDRTNVYAAEVEVRPPEAPTGGGASGRPTKCAGLDRHGCSV
jgi:hypothetical protein